MAGVCCAPMRARSLIAFMVLCACGPGDRMAGGDDGTSPPDGNGGGGGGDGGPGEQTFVYAQTATELYRVDPDTLAITLVGPFTFTGVREDITDIAIDKNNVMIGISFGSVYRIDPTTAAATKLSGGLSGDFNGLSFVPAATIGQTGDDVLVATRNTDGAVFRVDPATGGTTQIGNMGGFSSSGDLVSVVGFGTMQTADTGLGSPDRLVQLAQQTFTASPIGNTIGFADIWGLAFWKGKLFGFTDGGEFVTIDPATGGGTLVQGGGPEWWGAAVTTLAPVIQ